MGLVSFIPQRILVARMLSLKKIIHTRTSALVDMDIDGLMFVTYHLILVLG